MKASCTYVPSDFAPIELEVPFETGLPVGLMTMKKTYEGEMAGESFTLFTSAFDRGSNTGTYLAMEVFHGSLQGKEGGFCYLHLADTRGGDRRNEVLRIVPFSGTGKLTGIEGTGQMVIEPDWTHRLTLEYTLPKA